MADLPTGTVTLLFTDIEGSTRLLHKLGDGYAEALAEHRRLLREAFAAHGGVEVDTQGDAFFYAFARATDGLAAAAAGQQALVAGPMSVRMGVHTGEPRATAEGYVGADVHLAARVMSAGHGGQVLVSEATARLVDNELRDLGEHRLKDIERPVRLFQLGDGRFPPLKTLNNSNLPLPQTPLLGRKKELADVLRLLRVERARLVTVTGPGGIGKTRFALEAAHELVEDFAHGVWFVDLSALRDPALVVPTVAATLGAKDELVDHVADKELLLVVDNVEQVAEAAVALAELLRRCANVQLLVTSRAPLHVAGEREYPLRPLAESPAVQLFRERAEAVDPDFDAPWETLTAIVDRLDRLPLAIELAAARVKVLEPVELLARLDQRLPLLASSARDLPERQRTLRAAIEWSYELLDQHDQELFRDVAVFAGGCTFEDAEEVCGATLEGLESLVDKSLLRFGGGRFDMLQTVREYALEALERAGEPARLRRRQAESVARRGSAVSMAEPQPDADNWRAAVNWALEADAELAGRLAAVGLRWRLTRREALAVVRRAIACGTGRIATDLEIELLTEDAWGSSILGDSERAVAAAERAYELGAARGDDAAQAMSLHILATFATKSGDRDHAADLAGRSLDLSRRSDDPAAIANALHILGELELDRGELSHARELLMQSLELHNDESRSLSAIHGLGDVELEAGNFAAARVAYRRLLKSSVELQIWRSAAWGLAGLAAVAAAERNAERAWRLWGASEVLFERRGLPAEAASSPRYRVRLDALDAQPRARALEAGRTLPLEDAVALALSVDSP